ncbi:MAG: DivIVA domain-containing protein [Actinobacteria bacterium]|nr:DivIVA domain-containing protein [Actinomycetota bacterium]
MTLTPVELHHASFGRGLFGYRRGAVDRLLEEATESYESVWRDRGDLADRVEQLETDLSRYRELEVLLRTTLISAERTAHELKTAAQREAEQIVSEAHAEARAVTRRAAAQNEQLVAECRRLRSLMRSALATLDEGVGGEDEARFEPPQAVRLQA